MVRRRSERVCLFIAAVATVVLSASFHGRISVYPRLVTGVIAVAALAYYLFSRLKNSRKKDPNPAYSPFRRDGSTYTPLADIPSPEAPSPHSKVTGAWTDIKKEVQ